MPIHVKVSGVWQEVSKVHQRISGTWEEMDKVHTRVAGTWQEVYTGTVIRSYIKYTGTTLLWQADTKSLVSRIGYGDGLYFTTSGSSGNGWVTSPDGDTWTSRGTYFNTKNDYALHLYDPINDTYITLASEGDGQVYSADKAVYSTGNILASYQTPVWSELVNDESGFTGAAYGNGILMAVGYYDILLASSDGGANWTRYDGSAVNGPDNMWFHSAGNRFWFAGGENYNNAGCWFTTTGASFTEITNLGQASFNYEYPVAVSACETNGIFIITRSYTDFPDYDYNYSLYRIADPSVSLTPVLVNDGMFATADTDSSYLCHSSLMTSDGTLYFHLDGSSNLYSLASPWTGAPSVVTGARSGTKPVMLHPADSNYAIFADTNATATSVVMPVPV